MIEKDAYDFLRDIPVDQPGTKSVAPLMRRQVDRSSVFVLDVASLQPAVELASVGVCGQWASAVGVVLRPWVAPNRSGWTFWTIDSTGERLKTLRNKR